jgi:hypothetical protein
MANINNHTLEIYVNGIPIDLFDEGVNLRINKVINDPTKINTSQAEYSFTFNLPITPTNSKAFNYANISSKSNKFSGRFKCDVYADSIQIFEGTIKVSEVSEGSFKCNLFKSKINTLETIFGESTMNEVNWKVPFIGTDTINEVNADMSTKYFFPLVAYSLFNKIPSSTSDSGNRHYTDKYTIDMSNSFYYNSFVPSLNLVEVLKKCCELKGYELQGDIISDRVLNDIYLSNYIADEQDPLYNYGIPEMGEASFDFNFINTTNTTSRGSMDFIEYPLQYIPPYPSTGDRQNFKNYDTAFVYNMMMDDSRAQITNIKNESKLVVNGGVQIPADGWYQIELTADFGVSSTQGSMSNIYQCTGVTWTYDDGYTRNFANKTINYSLEEMPVEIHINKYNAGDGSIDNMSFELIYKGDYPNEAPWYTYLTGNGRQAIRNTVPYSLYQNVTGSTEGQSVTTAVDHYVNPDFVCGLSQSNVSRSVAYIKNGYSWHSDDKTSVEAIYNCNGYPMKNLDNWIQTDVNQNTLMGTTSTSCVASSGRHSKGTCRMIIKLQKNDMLVPFIIQRGYYDEDGNPKTYLIEANGSFKIKAIAPEFTGRSKLSWNMDSLFDKDLNLGNFLNKEQKISEFIENVQKAFNLSFEQDGSTIILNKNKISKNIIAPIDIDKKVNTMDAIYTAIDFPRSIEVKWSIDTEEEGFYRSVEDNTTEEQMQSNNWKDYGDYGYEKVNVSQADDSTDLNQQLQFSYNWNREFKVLNYKLYLDTLETLVPTIEYNTVTIPVIGKTDWWIEGFDYEGNAKYDGRGFKQRFWFRNSPTTDLKYKLPVNYEYDKTDDWYQITTISNYKQYGSNVVYLNYNNGTNTLLGKYFNVDINSASDEVEVEVYLTPDEYRQISMGASVHFDDNLYKVMEIQGYDPSGVNPTKLKLLSY